MDRSEPFLEFFSGTAKRIAKSIIFRNAVPCFWSKSENWGDALTPHLVKLISGKPARYDENPLCWKNFVTGSIMHRADRYSIVWGSGMIAPDALPAAQPHAIHAVRGPLTRERLIQAGIPCPEVYGDPALLLPRFFKPPRSINWKLGVIPHYTDQNHPWINAVRKEEGVNVINIRVGFEDFVLEVLACERVLSSSLHGLICADAYSIPNRRMVLRDELIGGDFKFLDYYGAMNLIPEAPIHPKSGESAGDLNSTITRHSCSLDLDRLIAACPFRS